MSLPFAWVGPLSGLVCGGLFGFVLERGGLGDGCKLTGQLRLENWTVFNVMFTAIIVAAAGLWLLDATGLMPASTIFVPTTFFWAALIGGALVGLGMAVGGYCPGTSVVAACAGRIDGVFFFAGLLAGTLAFAGAFDRLGPWLQDAAPTQYATVPQLLHLPGWLVVAMLAAIAGLVNWFISHDAKPPIKG